MPAAFVTLATVASLLASGGRARAEDTPVEEPPYDAAAHGGLTEAVWLRATRVTVRRSTPMMATGIGLTSLGASLVTAGLVAGAVGSSCSNQQVIAADGTTRTICGAMTGQTVGAILGAAGLVNLAIGVPLTVFGAASVPRQEAESASATVRPTLLLGLRTTGFAIKF